MNGKSSLVSFMGLALIVANLWRSYTLAGKLTFNWKNLGIEGAGVVAATFIAGASDQMGTVLVVFFAVLWVLFVINLTTKSTKKGAPANG